MSELARRQQQFAEGLLGQSEAILPISTPVSLRRMPCCRFIATTSS